MLQGQEVGSSSSKAPSRTREGAFVWAAYGAKSGVLLLLGLGLGLALFPSRFGFISAWRQLIAVGNGQDLRAHTVLLGTAATLVALIAGTGTGTGLFGSKPAPAASPLGLASSRSAVPGSD